jgi:hypothetical protein
MGFTFGAVMVAAGLAAVFGTQSRRTFAHPASPRAEALHFFSGMWLFLKDRDFRALWIAFTLCSLSVVVNFSLGVHFLKWYAGIEDQRWRPVWQPGSGWPSAARSAICTRAR